MNKSLSLLFCLSLVFPVHAMKHAMEIDDGIPQTYMNTPRRIAHQVWEAVSCKKVFIAAVCIAVVGFLSTGGYFLTNTCLGMQDGCNKIQTGCTRMENSCNNCTRDFTHANCGLELLGAYAGLLQKLIRKYPNIALEYAIELSHLNGTQC